MRPDRTACAGIDPRPPPDWERQAAAWRPLAHYAAPAGTPPFYDGSHFITGLAAADLNHDGHLDLVSADNSGYEVQNPDGSFTEQLTDFVTIWRGKGNGTFAAPVEVHTGVPGPQEVKLADVNHDGKPDLVVLGGGRVTVLLNLGNGQFGAPKSYKIPTAPGLPIPQALATGDVNGDGNTDVIVGRQTFSTPGSVVVFSGSPSGVLHSPVTFGTGATRLQNLTLADVNGDGRPDIVTANDTSGAGVSVLLNTTK